MLLMDVAMDSVADLNLENAGPLVTGTPKRGKNHHNTRLIGTPCKNCDTPLTGDYCHACGQSAHVHRSFLHVLEEVVHGITHFDSKTWRSLPMLVFRPGTMTRNYVMGHRSRYVPPFSMFLASVFSMFLVFALVGGPGFVKQNNSTPAERVDAAREHKADVATDLKEGQADLATSQAALAAIKAKPKADQDPVDVKLAEAEVASQTKAVQTLQARLNQADADLTQAVTSATAQTQPMATDADEKAQAAKRAQQLADLRKERDKAVAGGDQVAIAAIDAAIKLVESNAPATAQIQSGNVTAAGNDFQTNFANFLKSDVQIESPWPELNEKLRHKLQNPELFLYKLQNTVYKFSFLLIPISLPFIWLLLFWKRDVTLYDHAVFALYSLSFMSFLFLGLALSSHWISWSDHGGWIFGAVITHLYFHFKGAYNLGWIGAGWRTAVFGAMFAPVALALFFVAIIVLGAVG